MKAEYHHHRDDKTQPPTTTTNMFSKFHHSHSPPQTTPPPPFSTHHHHHHNFQLSNTSEEADSRSRSPTGAFTPTTNTKKDDGSSVETLKRPRGRPPGSKNKPKPPVIITREPDPSMSPYVLELPAGTDIIDSILSYSRKRNTALCILTASGTVSNVSLRQPSTTTTVTFHGRFDILSISATVFPSSSPAAPFANGFSISLAGPQGQIVGGAVAGQLVAAGTVYVIAASFNNPLYHRLPGEDENSGGGSGEQCSPPGAGGENQQTPPATAGETMTMGMYNTTSDVIWAPTARQAQLHPPPY